MKKLFINETDSHGCGIVCYNGKVEWYSYDDPMGDICSAVQFLIDLGFIDPDSVEIFNDERPVLVEYEKLLHNIQNEQEG